MSIRAPNPREYLSWGEIGNRGVKTYSLALMIWATAIEGPMGLTMLMMDSPVKFNLNTMPGITSILDSTRISPKLNSN